MSNLHKSPFILYLPGSKYHEFTFTYFYITITNQPYQIVENGYCPLGPRVNTEIRFFFFLVYTSTMIYETHSHCMTGFFSRAPISIGTKATQAASCVIFYGFSGYTSYFSQPPCFQIMAKVFCNNNIVRCTTIRVFFHIIAGNRWRTSGR